MDEHVDAWPETPWRRNWKRENVTVEDGALVIRTVREPVGFSTGGGDDRGLGKPILFQQAFGRFEARVRFPTAAGPLVRLLAGEPRTTAGWTARVGTGPRST